MDTKPGRMWIEYVLLEDVVRWPRNPKAHDLGQISASFDRFGYADPILVDETSGQLVAGHGRLEALQAKQAAGDPAPDRIEVAPDGTWHVPVIRGIGFESETEAEAYLLAHNRLVERGGWNDAELEAMLREHAATGFGGMGWDPETFMAEPQGPDLASLMPPEITPAPAAPVPPAAPEKPERATKIKAEPPQDAAKSGEIWALGRHRLVVGDPQDRDDIPAEVVLDLFSGGSELLVREVDRPSYTMVLPPKWAAAIIALWTKLTGETAAPLTKLHRNCKGAK